MRRPNESPSRDNTLALRQSLSPVDLAHIVFADLSPVKGALSMSGLNVILNALLTKHVKAGQHHLLGPLVADLASGHLEQLVDLLL